MFHENLRKVRTSKNISQMHLARELGVSQQTIGRWETNTASPNPEKLAQIAAYFNVSADYLLDLSMEPQSTETIEAAQTKYVVKVYAPEQKDAALLSSLDAREEKLGKFIRCYDLSTYPLDKRQEIGKQIKQAIMHASKPKKLMSELDVTLRDLNAWANGNFETLDIVRLAKLCGLLNQSIFDLTREEALPQAAELMPEEDEMNEAFALLEAFFCFNRTGQQKISEYIKDLYANENYRRE